MTTDEPPPAPAKPRYVAAALAMWIFAAMFAIQIATVIATKSAEQRASTRVAPMIEDLCVVGALVWLGARLRSGRSAGVACLALGACGLLIVATVAVVILVGVMKGDYEGEHAVAAVQCTTGLAWLAAMTLAVRAWAAR